MASCRTTVDLWPPHIPKVRRPRPHDSDPREKSEWVRRHATDQTTGLMARQCEACQCLLSENGMMGNGWRVTTGRKSGHIPPATDQSDERCQAESIHGQRSEKQVWHGQLSVWICREGTQRGLWKDLPGHKPNARGLHLQNVTDTDKNKTQSKEF